MTALRRDLRRLGVLLSTLVAAACVTAGPSLTREPECSDVAVIFARGTNEAPGVGEVGQAFVDALRSRLPGRTLDVYGVNYPASYDFATGVQGVIDTSHRIEATAAACPQSRIVLGGYSQGAAVTGYTLIDSLPPGFVLPEGLTGPMPQTVAPHVAAVVMFGTPKPWVVNLLASQAPPMSIGPDYTAKMLQLCALRDPICDTGGLDRAAHHAYLDNGMIGEGADFAARAI
ncbi:cutinase family protein [Mycolicibacterium sp. J2]|uniref:cutinase family protein n=1 Tax=Mycolicibacterium sp. J2 TaxID=2993511 RepID=UPI00224A4D7F|nr:cutinase family protein [Mycolicibacterium sp. J2]MCX2713595.1 cutinase family protein [Mycolicibacterium sp. J2]